MTPTTPKRVLYIENGEYGGGSAESLYQLLTALDRRAVEPVVVTTNPIRQATKIAALGVPVIRLDHWLYSRSNSALKNHFSTWAKRLIVHGGRWLPIFGFLAEKRLTGALTCELLGIIRERKIDLLHTNNNIHRDYWAIEAAAVAGVPCVSHLRSFHSLGFSRGKAARINALVHTYIGYSQSIVDHWTALGVDPEKCKVVHNAIGTIPPSSLVVDELLPGKTRIGIVGRIIPERGHDVLLAAMPMVLAKMSSALLLVVGDGDEKSLDDLREIANRFGIGANVEFLGQRRDAVAVISELDVLVLPYTIEPFGRTVLEAWQVGTPVVMTNVGRIGDIVTDEVDALLFKPGDCADLARQILRVLESDALRGTLVENGRRVCTERFSIESQASKLLTIYAAAWIAASPVDGAMRSLADGLSTSH